MHPLQHELETARHMDYQDRAARQRQVAEAEHLASGRAASASGLRTIAARDWWHASRSAAVAVLKHALV
jgi:hypothetical protein